MKGTIFNRLMSKQPDISLTHISQSDSIRRAHPTHSRAQRDSRSHGDPKDVRSQPKPNRGRERNYSDYSPRSQSINPESRDHHNSRNHTSYRSQQDEISVSDVDGGSQPHPRHSKSRHGLGEKHGFKDRLERT